MCSMARQREEKYCVSGAVSMFDDPGRGERSRRSPTTSRPKPWASSQSVDGARAPSIGRRRSPQ